MNEFFYQFGKISSDRIVFKFLAVVLFIKYATLKNSLKLEFFTNSFKRFAEKETEFFLFLDCTFEFLDNIYRT